MAYNILKGNVRNPTKCAFNYGNSTTRSNVTGDNTTYTLIFDTAVVNQGSNFDGVSTFTAPITGLYNFAFNLLTQGNVAANYIQAELLIPGFIAYVLGPDSGSKVGNNPYSFKWNSIPMIVGETAQILITVAGGTKTVSVYGDGALRTAFSGYFVC